MNRNVVDGNWSRNVTQLLSVVSDLIREVRRALIVYQRSGKTTTKSKQKANRIATHKQVKLIGLNEDTVCCIQARIARHNWSSVMKCIRRFCRAHKTRVPNENCWRGGGLEEGINRHFCPMIWHHTSNMKEVKKRKLAQKCAPRLATFVGQL